MLFYFFLNTSVTFKKQNRSGLYFEAWWRFNLQSGVCEAPDLNAQWLTDITV